MHRRCMQGVQTMHGIGTEDVWKMEDTQKWHGGCRRCMEGVQRGAEGA